MSSRVRRGISLIKWSGKEAKDTRVTGNEDTEPQASPESGQCRQAPTEGQRVGSANLPAPSFAVKETRRPTTGRGCGRDPLDQPPSVAGSEEGP